MKSWNEIRKAATAFVLLASARTCLAEVLVAPRLPEPATVGMEVSTNLDFNAVRSDLRRLEVRMECLGTASNCVQLAFGRDLDSDGVLAPEETSLTLGWRCGRYFIEDAATGQRHEEDALPGGGSSRSLSLNVLVDDKLVLKTAAARDEANRVLFAEVLSPPPAWLQGVDWDMCQVTRRGVDSPLEVCRAGRGYGYFHVFVR